MATITTGFHRIGNVTTRAPFGVEQQAVPGATIYVTLTSSGTAATIYSDPGMTVPITGALLTADIQGNYDYYIPLNYSVTETISSPNNSGFLVVSNIVQNGPLVASLTTTNSTSDTVSLTGVVGGSHFSLQPRNSSAATMITSTYVSAASSGSFTVTHPATAGAIFDIIVTPY